MFGLPQGYSAGQPLKGALGHEHTYLQIRPQGFTMWDGFVYLCQLINKPTPAEKQLRYRLQKLLRDSSDIFIGHDAIPNITWLHQIHDDDIGAVKNRTACFFQVDTTGSGD